MFVFTSITELYLPIPANINQCHVSFKDIVLIDTTTGDSCGAQACNPGSNACVF